MKWFGESWDAPACYPADHVATPLGVPCFECRSRIGKTDQGFLLPFVDAAGDALMVPYHLGCLLDAISPCRGCPICVAKKLVAKK